MHACEDIALRPKVSKTLSGGKIWGLRWGYPYMYLTMAWQYQVAKIRPKERKHITRKQCKNLSSPPAPPWLHTKTSTRPPQKSLLPHQIEASQNPPWKDRRFSEKIRDVWWPWWWRLMACHERKIRMLAKLRSDYPYQRQESEVSNQDMKHPYRRARTVHIYM